jgi:hypothetical protein
MLRGPLCRPCMRQMECEILISSRAVQPTPAPPRTHWEKEKRQKIFHLEIGLIINQALFRRVIFGWRWETEQFTGWII